MPAYSLTLIRFKISWGKSSINEASIGTSAIAQSCGETMLEKYEGHCHCGRVHFRVRADITRTAECNCSVCVKKGLLHLIVPPEQFEIISGKEALTTYRFNTGIAKHTFCETCGVQPFYLPRSDPDKIDINVRCLDGVDIATLTPRKFNGSNWEESMATAERNNRGA